MENSMMLVKSEWNNKPSFRAIPVVEQCPYVECIFDPESKVFVIISKTKRNTLQMLPKLDEYGAAITGAKGMKQERHKLEVFQEYYVDDKASVEDLIKMLALNSDTFDYKSFFKEEKKAK
jgi:hypothetical protein